MKLLVISNMYPSDKDPVYGVFVKNFFDYVEAHNQGGRTKLIAIKGRDKSRIKNVWSYLRFYTEIFCSCVFRRWDLVYVHTITFPTVSLRAASMFRNLSLAFNIHGSDLITHSKLAEILKKMCFPLLRRAKLIVVPSTVFKQILVDEVAQIEEKNVYVSPSGGVDTQLFVPIVKQKGNTIVLGFVSHIIAMKGWRLFIEAIEKLRQKGYNVKGIMAGNGSEENELRELLKTGAYQEIISYIGGIPQQDLPQIYNQFDLFVFPTLFCESLGLVGLEAMACGVPVVGSDKGGLTEYVKHEENGFLFKQGNVKDLVKQVESYMNLSQKEKEGMSYKARETSLYFNSETVLWKLYDKLKGIV